MLSEPTAGQGDGGKPRRRARPASARRTVRSGGGACRTPGATARGGSHKSNIDPTMWRYAREVALVDRVLDGPEAEVEIAGIRHGVRSSWARSTRTGSLVIALARGESAAPWLHGPGHKRQRDGGVAGEGGGRERRCPGPRRPEVEAHETPPAEGTARTGLLLPSLPRRPPLAGRHGTRAMALDGLGTTARGGSGGRTLCATARRPAPERG